MKTSIVSAVAILPITTVSAFEVADIYKTTLGSRADYSLDLNTCFANYVGSLNHVANGGFADSCTGCHMDGTKLICECLVGADRGIKRNEVELDDWNLIQVNEESLGCGSTVGFERSVGKSARFFTA
ncbi:uncharacterized protein F4812DRAFT_463974 [Daldinia caldariorum]|uniref:uncharacterized protein n=1 Tax=Daldinia caldariorum TaxID=326644 RepID=UPI002008774D|nr:uncharacterized protein F4812DRAFT_463974 [Daldinia caldariorum]KAI1463119.1 hypothetical protein F4812DRAFT_463974 [Daldinia caldariorum]